MSEEKKEVGYSLLSAIVGAVQLTTNADYETALVVAIRVENIIKDYDWIELRTGTTFGKTFEVKEKE